MADTTLEQEPDLATCDECEYVHETVELVSSAGNWPGRYCRACLLDALAVFTAAERVAGES